MKHKHADVLIAIAEGKEVEYRTEAHNWLTPSTDTVNPITFPGLLWRVKPEPEAEWKQKLRQAAREGKQLQVRCADGSFVNVNMELVDADTVDLSVVKESDYRIVPKTVTRWLWAYSTDGAWWLAPMLMTEEEVNMRYPLKSVQKIESTKTEFPE